MRTGALAPSASPIVVPPDSTSGSQGSSEQGEAGFVDRRSASSGRTPGVERRQFGNSHRGLTEAGRELAQAVDRYKVRHARRFINFDELLQILEGLGYRRP